MEVNPFCIYAHVDLRSLFRGSTFADTVLRYDAVTVPVMKLIHNIAIIASNTYPQ